MASLTIKQIWKDATSSNVAEGKDASTLTPLSLSDQQADEILSNVVYGRSVFSEFLTQFNPVISANQAILKFAKIQGGRFKEKQLKDFLDVDPYTTTATEEVQWDKAVQASQAVTLQEAQESGVIIPAMKAEKLVTQFANNAERVAFQRLAKKIKADNCEVIKANLANLSSLELRKMLIEKATQLTDTIDGRQGLDGIDPDDIVILVKPELLDKIALDAGAGNFALQTITEGAKTITTIGGYKAVPCRFLQGYDAIVTVSFVGVKAEALNQVYYGPLAASSTDLVVRVEGKTASKILWDRLAYGFAAASPTIDDTKYIQVEADNVKLSK